MLCLTDLLHCFAVVQILILQFQISSQTALRSVSCISSTTSNTVIVTVLKLNLPRICNVYPNFACTQNVA